MVSDKSSSIRPTTLCYVYSSDKQPKTMLPCYHGGGSAREKGCHWQYSFISLTRYDHVLEFNVKEFIFCTLENPCERWQCTLSSFIFHQLQPLPTSFKCHNTQFLDFEHGSSVSRRPRYTFSHRMSRCQLSDLPTYFNLQGILHSPTTVPNLTPACSCSKPICSVLRPIVPSGSEMPNEWGYHTSRTAQVSSVPPFV